MYDWVCSIFNICCTMSYVMLPCRTYVHWRARSIVAKRLCIVLSNLILSNPILSPPFMSDPNSHPDPRSVSGTCQTGPTPNCNAAQHCTYCFAPYCSVLCYTALNRAVLCCIALHCNVLPVRYDSMLCCTVLCCAVLSITTLSPMDSNMSLSMLLSVIRLPASWIQLPEERAEHGLFPRYLPCIVSTAASYLGL